MNVPIDDWSGISDRFEGGDILVGNGASIAVWQGFRYVSLYNQAVASGILSAKAVGLFNAEDTTDFETVLRDLNTSRRVAAAIGQEPSEYDAYYGSIRQSLIDVVVANHVPWPRVTDRCLAAIRDSLGRFSTVFTTNYDLLVYWAMRHVNDNAFKDTFWSGNLQFDPLDAEISTGTGVYWVHGGLHLHHTWTGITRKRVNDGANLLSTFGTDPTGTPLIVSEGTAEQKMSRIGDSAYLQHAYRCLAGKRTALTVFGNSLNPISDGHLLHAIGASGTAWIAVSVHEPTVASAAESWGRMKAVLPSAEVRIFDAASHPLAQPA